MSNRDIKTLDYKEDLDYEITIEDGNKLYKVGYSYYICPECDDSIFAIVYLGTDYLTSDSGKWITYIDDDDMRFHMEITHNVGINNYGD